MRALVKIGPTARSIWSSVVALIVEWVSTSVSSHGDTGSVGAGIGCGDQAWRGSQSCDPGAFVALLLGLLMVQIWLTAVFAISALAGPPVRIRHSGRALIVVTGGCIVTLGSFDRLGCCSPFLTNRRPLPRSSASRPPHLG